MLAIELRFPTGRYHATPWGRHVNEGIPEWPPSPYRLVRALYDTWKRKRPGVTAEEIEELLSLLASTPPFFHLPPARASHTRSFLSTNAKDPTDRALVFDGFIVVQGDDPVLIAWPSVELSWEQERNLEELLSLLNYLGRSESWVDARLSNGPADPRWNCFPLADTAPQDNHEIVTVACPVARESYSPTGSLNAPRGSSRRAAVARAGTWLEALAWSTGDLLESRRNDPPALEHVPYLRPSDSFDVRPAPRRARSEREINGVLFALESGVPPPVTSALEIAERVRRKLMGLHKRIVGDPTRISPVLSGKDSIGRPLSGHRHLYLLPIDRDADGRLDHLLAVSRDPLGPDERLALDRLESVWQPGGRPDLRLVPLTWGTRAELCRPARRFKSVSPFVPPRHYRAKRGSLAEWLAAEVRREASNHGLPEPVGIAPLERIECRGRTIRWIEFRRNRKDDPARLGYGFQIEFAEEIVGPVALGYGAHFGLGLFLPSEP